LHTTDAPLAMHMSPLATTTQNHTNKIFKKTTTFTFAKAITRKQFLKIKTKLTSDYNNLAHLLSSTSPTTNNIL
jgi:hypothetical protein